MSEPWVLTEPPPPGTKEPYGSAPSQHLWIRRPPGSTRLPTLVMIHGGYWRAAYDAGHVGHLCADLARRGWATVALEYRRIGEPGGAWPGTLTDVALALDALPGLADRYGLDLPRAVWMGHSAGGHLALWAAGRAATKQPGTKPWLVVSLAGVCDLTQAARLRLSGGAAQLLLGGEPEELPAVYQDADPVHRVPLGVRQLLVHGTADRDVPLALSENYAAVAVRAGDDCTLWTLPGVDHFALVDPGSAAWAAVLDELP